MRAIVLKEAGGPEVMSIGELPEPVLREGDVLVGVRAAGLNRADLLQRMGFYPPPPGEPETLGLEVSGEVLALGPGACVGAHGRPLHVGERVMALLAGGGYAERARVPAAQCLSIPAGLSFEQAAAIPEVFLTAHLNLTLLGRLAAGEVVVVHAAGSGVGTAALQLCRGIARVIVATASEGKLERCRSLGATHVLARERVAEGLKDAVKQAAGRGADLILDCVGGSYLEANIAALGLHGRLCCISTAGGAEGTLHLGALLGKRLSVLGSTLRTRTAAQKAKLCRHFSEHVLPRFERQEGALVLAPVLAQALPWTEVAQAHAQLEANDVFGKLVLRM
ncbi:MAG: NAD(P)H-quinone oxidoreductase [Deltaproteobacteria bacterium]|nr:NAD(P)H-quinone oxidoreductase [Deltaproteobacteria bacterium]